MEFHRQLIFALTILVLGQSSTCYNSVCDSIENSCDKNDKIDAQLSSDNEVFNKSNEKRLISSSVDDKVNFSVKLSYVLTNNQSTVLSEHRFVDYTIYEIMKKNGSIQDYRRNELPYPPRNEEREFISTLGKRLQTFSRPFDASRSPTASSECKEHSKLFLNAFNNFDLWALRMHDSSAKLPSGILNGNINQFGDFDQCLRIRGPVENLGGRYCLSYLQASVSEDLPYLKQLHTLVQSHGAFKSEFNDPGHRIPRFSLINWALCVPSSCTALDVEHSLKEYVRNLTMGTGISFQIRVEPRMCQLNEDDKPFDRGTKLAITFFLSVLGIVFMSTIYDWAIDREQKSELMRAFSLKKNMKWLFSVRSPPGDIGCIHGIRFLNALMLLFSHKSMAIFFNPYINRTDMTELLGKSWTVVARAASIYTDPFLMFSGMLTAYSLFGKLQKGQKVNLKSEYVGRLLRIVPTLGALILFCTYILPLMGSGPQWNLVVGHHSEICKQHWWRNLLFIHNYFGFGNMCLTHTHHLGIDTELFAVSPIMIFGLWRWPKKGFLVLLTLAGLATSARFHTTVVNRLSNYVYFGTSIQRLFKTADYMYSFPPHRCTVYILGIFVGYALRVYPNMRLTRAQLRCGWVASAFLFCLALLGPAPMGDINYKYNPVHAACYAAFAPIAWCCLFAWIIWTSQLGYKNRLTQILSWKGFQITTKLSYAIYLTQFPTFFFNVGRKRNIDYYSFIPLLADTNEYFCILLASTILTLLFDAPFQNIKKVMSKTTSSAIRNKAVVEKSEGCEQKKLL